MTSPGAPEEAPAGPTVLLFVRAPVLGEVKTRLARTLGAERATALYRTLGRGTADRLRSGPWRFQIHGTPATPEATESIEGWLEPEAGTLFPQGEGDLGARLAQALTFALAEGGPACVVASDVPELGASEVAAAFQALDQGADLVLGPSPDGGYYLLALARWTPGLFRDIPWSTPQTLEASLARAAQLGLRVSLLSPLRDVDEAEDLEALGLAFDG
jgi:uncharacterized protein